MNEPETPPDPNPSQESAPRNPVERAIVWGVILIGLGIAAYEARAKFGYDKTLETLGQKLKEVDESGEEMAQFTFEEAVKVASFSPSISDEEQMYGLRKTRIMKWPSIAKTYELKLILDADDVLLHVETSEPPEEPVPEIPAGSDDSNSTITSTPTPTGGGGPPPSHDAQAGSTGDPGGGGPGEGGATGGGGRRGGPNRGLLGLISNEAVAAEINLTDDQKEKLTQFEATIEAESTGAGPLRQQLRDASDEQRQSLIEQLTTMRTALDVKIVTGLGDILDEQQLTRLQQIDWQSQGARALTTSVVMERLGLSEEQQASLAELSEKRSSEMRELGFQAARENREAVTNKYNAEFVAVLTAEQSQAWNNLLGEKFEDPSERPQRPASE